MERQLGVCFALGVVVQNLLTFEAIEFSILFWKLSLVVLKDALM